LNCLSVKRKILEMLPDSSDLARSFIRKLLYFDIFSHPLLAKEIFEYCDFPDVKEMQGVMVLKELQNHHLIGCESGFYFIGDDTSKAAHRIEYNELARQRMTDARKYSFIAASFPFVRAVFISGTLSKNVMKPDSDIDFFIITEPGKLWICRAFLTLYKKLLLGNSHRNFCLNYFIDSNNLEIPDKNIFTATEVAFLLPMYNYSLYERFMEKNLWIRDEFPNFKPRRDEITICPPAIKKVLEYIFDNRFGRFLDRLSFSVILSYWKRKFRDMNEKSFSLNLRSQKDVSKHHPSGFQERVISQYSAKILAFEQSSGFLLTEPDQLKATS